LTIPKALIDEMTWQDVEFVIMTNLGDGTVRIRRFIDGESLRTELETDSIKPR